MICVLFFKKNNSLHCDVCFIHMVIHHLKLILPGILVITFHHHDIIEAILSMFS